MIAGFPVPEGTAVGVTQFAANRQTSNFTRPNDFVPERWLSVEQAGQIGEKIGDSALAQDVEQFAGMCAALFVRSWSAAATASDKTSHGSSFALCWLGCCGILTWRWSGGEVSIV